MNSRYDGGGVPGGWRRIVDGVWLRAARRGSRRLTVRAAGLPELHFRCDTIAAYNRITSAWSKEPGTVRWLRSNVRPGDVVLDVGANIGTYSLLAAALAGPDGRVYACEPHAATLADLLANVSLNGFSDRVSVLSCALADAPGTVSFDYRSLERASALSQLGGGDFKPAATELKAVASVDALVADGVLRPPALVKIDVDGSELDVLRGMRDLLAGPQAPRSIQVEIHEPAIASLLEDAGYRLVDRHSSVGAPADEQAPANGIFER